MTMMFKRLCLSILIIPAILLISAAVFAAENPLGKTSQTGGVGLQLGEQNGVIVVIQTALGMPAEAAGVRERDLILGVDGKLVNGKSAAQVASVIIGRVGTPVKINVRHPDGTTEELTLARASARGLIPQRQNQAEEVTGADERQLPKEYSVAGRCDAGRSLVCLRDNIHSARQMLMMNLTDLSAYFDARPTIDVAYGDQDDRTAVTAFRSMLKGKEMKGAIFAGVGEKGASSTVVFDRQSASPAALARLAAAAKPVGNLHWTQTRIPDGSGLLTLPDNWKITSAGNGALDVAGPNGQTISLGIAFTIFTPEAEAKFQQQRSQLGLPHAPTGFLVAPFSEPVEAVKTLVPQFSKMSQAARQPPYRLLSIIETTPLEDHQGHTAYVRLLIEIGTGDAAVRQESLALVKCMPMGGGQWQYYFSQVTGPQALFQRDLPTMIQIWQSWKLDPNSVRDRMNKALAVMSQTRDMLKRSADYQDRVRAQSSADWDSIITGYTTIVDKATGQQSDKNTANVKYAVDKLNAKAGYHQFIEIPLAEN